MRALHTIWAVCLVLTLAACADDQGFVGPVGTQSDAGFLLPSGSPAGVGVLRLLNDDATTFEVLDDEVGLDRRAAAGLIHHRNGPDGLYGTRDDAPFYSIEEIDAVKYVGPAALDALVKFADREGWVPVGDDELGVYDSVAFTVFEAFEVLELANYGTERALDVAVHLDRRAVKSILDARPIQSVRDLAELPYVGRSALTMLKRYAPNFIN